METVSGRLSPTELVTHSSFSVRYSEIDIHLNTSTSNRCSILLLPFPIPSSTFAHVVLVAAEQLALLSGPLTPADLIVVRQLLLQHGPPHLTLVPVLDQLALLR
jgi:hypothetical protein